MFSRLVDALAAVYFYFQIHKSFYQFFFDCCLFKIDNLFVSVPYLVVTWPPLTKCFTSPQEKVIKNDQSNYLGQLWQVIQSILFSVTYFVSSIWSFLFTSSAIFDRIHIFCEQSSVQSVSDFKCSSRCFCFLHFVEQLVTFGYKKYFFLSQDGIGKRNTNLNRKCFSSEQPLRWTRRTKVWHRILSSWWVVTIHCKVDFFKETYPHDQVTKFCHEDSMALLHSQEPLQ